MAYQVWRYGFWVRLFGVGISVRRDTPSFSERNGYARIFRVCGWIVKPLWRATR
jgi:hypothetical protein